MRNDASRPQAATDLNPSPPPLPVSVELPPAPPRQRSGPKCGCCLHPEKWRLEVERASGVPLDALAKKYGLSRSSIHRHWTSHVDAKAKVTYLAGPSDMAALHAKAAAEGASVLDYLHLVRNSLMAAMATASEMGDPRGVASVGSALINCLEKLGRITGEIAQLAGNNTTINMQIVNSPEFIRIQQAQIVALAPFPDALAAVVAAWRALDTDAADASMRTISPPPARAAAAPVTIEATVAPLDPSSWPPPPPAPPEAPAP